VKTLAFGVAALVLVGCGDDAANAPELVTNTRIVYGDGLHNENTEMIVLDDRILLTFRGGESAQIGSDRAHLNIYASFDGGETFEKRTEVDANNLPDGRDIRDPKLISFKGRLFLYAISRLPGGHYRDLGGKAWTVRSESTDGGDTWSDPVRTYDAADIWGFWRLTPRRFSEGGQARETLYATAYDDGDTTVALFASDDGVDWKLRGTIIDSYDDVPSEAELQFFGPNQETAVSIVRLDNQEILQDGESAICTSQAPFTDWECGRRIPQRIDGPTWLVHALDGVDRHFVFARKHLPCTRKRTAIYELRGDLADPRSPIEVCELAEVPSSGDTAYTALAPLGGDRFLLSWYTSAVDRDVPWLEGQFTPSDIWLADVDLSAAPDGCVHPAPKAACEPPALPTDGAPSDVSGRFMFALAPVIWPEQALLFEATVAYADGVVDLSLQPLDAATLEPAGAPWVDEGVAVGTDGRFTASFGSHDVAATVFPLLEDPFLSAHEMAFEGVIRSADLFCGNVTGYAQILAVNPADRITLDGSTFGATRAVESGPLPDPVLGCD